MPLECSVLLVADDFAYLDAMSRYLSRQGLHVIPVAHPRRAMAAASQHEVHVAIIDGELPEGDGFALASQLRARVGGLQVILVSRDGSPPDVDRAEKSGAFACVPRSLSARDLSAVVERALEGSVRKSGAAALTTNMA